jgi:hypothetical protein
MGGDMDLRCRALGRCLGNNSAEQVECDPHEAELAYVIRDR